jgi:hypothetical protein
MTRNAINRFPWHSGKTAGAAGLFTLLLFLGLAAVSPPVHEMVCPDADQPGHHCAVTDFATGLLEAPALAWAGLAVFFGVPTVLLWTKEPHRPAPLFRLSPSRAPPACGA